MITPEAVAAFNEKFDNSTYDDLDPSSYDRAVAEALEAAFAATPVSEPEPVAWYETELGEMVAWLLVEKLKKPDDVYYSEEDAISEIEKAITAPPSTERMREALAWYGEQARLARLIHSEGDPGRRALTEDGGKRARAALADQKGGAA